jgi:hypothetical protein
MPCDLSHVQQCRVIGAFIIDTRDVEAASLEERSYVFGGNRDAAPLVYFVADAASVDFVLTTKATEADKIAHGRAARSAARSVDETARSFRCSAARSGWSSARLAMRPAAALSDETLTVSGPC